MGYLRPDWVTFERDGMSSNSRFPKDPQTILELAKDLPEPDWTQRYDQTFLADASYDLLYNLPNVFMWFLYPFYERHALFHPLAEYYGWIIRLLRSKRLNAHAEATIKWLLARTETEPFFVYPLQLQTDYQLRAHSDFNGQEEAISTVLRSFAQHAPAQCRLVIKIHPLDNGLIHWPSVIAEEADALAIQDRIDVIDGGRLDLLFEKTRGVVTVNSTAALPALRMGKPVKALGKSIYDIAGLTHQQTLDQFWQHGQRPSQELVAAFFRLLAAEFQVRGNFYTATGSQAAADRIASKLSKARTVSC
jgi:capsular polysaccharide export protein